MRLYFTLTQYLKMSAAFWLGCIVIGSFSKKLRDKLQWGVSHAATCHVALRKVEVASTFSATCNAIFRCETSCKHGVSHEEVFLATCNATMPLRCKLQGKLPRVTWPLFSLSSFFYRCLWGTTALGTQWHCTQSLLSYLPSLISIVIDLETTSLEARSFAVGAYLSINRSP